MTFRRLHIIIVKWISQNLHQRVEEHKHSLIGKHFRDAHV